MSHAVKRPRPATGSTKETPRMSKRLTIFAMTLGAAMLLVFLPVASASAASPWWQVLTGSRPTNLWTASNNVQEIESEIGEVFGFEGVAATIEVEGHAVGCLGTANLAGTAFCEEVGFTPDETAAELQATLETAFATSGVEVTGGPAGGEPFRVTTVGRGAPVIQLTPINRLGSASAKVISQGGSGRLVLTLTNLGDAPVDGTTTPVTIIDELPAGVAATGVEAFAGLHGADGPVNCVVETSSLVSCAYAGTLPSYEALEVEVFASLTGNPPAAGAPGKVKVSGGNAARAGAVQEIKVSEAPTPFGIEQFSMQSEEEGGSVTSQAGAHPFQLTTTLQLNSGSVIPGVIRGKNITEQPALPRNLRFPLPAGLVGNATAVAECTMEDFLSSSQFVNKCPDDTAIGVASVTVIESANLGFTREAVPVFNLPPTNGEPARFGFMAVGDPIVVDTSLDPDDEYRIIASVNNVTQLAQFLSSTVSLWGTPGDPRHDSARGWGCVYAEHPGGCERPKSLAETPFLRQPVSCNAPLDFSMELEPWNVPIGSEVKGSSFPGEALGGCNRVPFDPSIAVAATSKLAENPSGINFQLTMPGSGLMNPNGISEAQPKKVEVALPEGMTLNPSAAEGLAVCSPADYAREKFDSAPGTGCPEASKIGNAQIKTPLVRGEVTGALYVAKPYENPFDSLLGLYLVARLPERGILVKLPVKVSPNPSTGQLTATVDDSPALPFESFSLHFREGGRAPLVTPPTCGNFQATARFTPWSAADPDNPAANEVVSRSSSFPIEHGVDGGACPAGGTPPFHPGLLAGTINNAAGTYSPFNVRLTREDGEQEFTHFSIKLPPGLIGKLAGIPFCSDQAIAAAKAKTGQNGGQEELEHPSCPAASEVGQTLVGAGVGSLLTYVPGKVYLAGPYHGSPLSVVAITAAKAGPFDLGTVVIRDALKINPETAEVSVDATGSDPIPHIINGVVVHARDIRVYINRPEFVLNPTNCERTSTASTVLGSGTNFASEADDQPVTVTSPFQAADCANLGFKPNLQLSLSGPTKRAGLPKLKAVVTYPKGGSYANIAKTVVTLPPSEFLEQAHIGSSCTRVQFNAGGGNGEQCPAKSILGKAKAITPLLDEPLEGLIYLRSNGGERKLPDLVAALHSRDININLVGFISSLHKKGSEVSQIRNTFAAVPDAPVSKFTLELFGGKKGLLVNSTNLCKGTHKAISEFTGQNGKVYDTTPAVKAQCGKKSKGSKKGQAGHHKKAK